MSKIQNFKMYINGEWVDSVSKKKIETLNPENNEIWATVPEANEKDVDKAVKAAQKAFEHSWSNLHPRERAKYLRTLGNLLRENAEHLGTIETIDTGKLFRETKTQANYIAEYYDYFAGLADKVEGTVIPIDKSNMQVTTTRIPIGVVAAIIPWNSQMLLTAVKLAPALAMGNTVVIKASELAPVTLLEFAKLVEKSGIPKGVINIITGLGEPCGKALTTHKLVERIAFTGGPETAKHIVKNSAENLSEVSLELGGKSPVVVFNDAEQENALNGITAGIFGASGQSCIAGSRLYIQSKIYDEFLNKLVKKAEKIKLGAPMDKDTQMGPLNSFKQLENIEKNIKETVKQGGKIRCGGKRSEISNKGYYFPATIIECKNHNLPTAENELFGPVLSVMKFDTEEEAVNKMNDNKYGLSSGVYTSNLGRGMRVSKAIRAGIVFVNTYRLISPMAPFGGIKDSGYGKEAGIESIKEYTRIKTTWYNSSDKPMEDPFTMG
ncbi:MAG: aldehyde dehydrogenase [Candidatus Pelagibacter sp. TMED106]|jgi:acyl-CoA reductase-like NAD-dependent aldehyde dehydrogenase|nr:MAG: aldehyde dehydrogenase [Candidatus Pelagibacter sp. TMED106]|tara:strand:- start:3165 stop:4646 length:1482 start_codon:yes stop_codon:yes gene_type:complete